MFSFKEHVLKRGIVVVENIIITSLLVVQRSEINARFLDLFFQKTSTVYT